jgi:putative membrane protein
MFIPHHEPVGQFGYLFAILGGLAWLAIVAGIVLLVIWAIRAMPRSTFMATAPSSTVESPEDILARRFAMGEISAEDYTRSRDLLRGGPGTNEATPSG